MERNGTCDGMNITACDLLLTLSDRWSLCVRAEGEKRGISHIPGWPQNI